MFTGIIEEKGILHHMERRGPGGVMTIEAPRIAAEFSQGESVAVSGACLTVSSLTTGGFSADLSGETWGRTHFSQKHVGSRLNLERALRVTDRLGGHLVTGHIDGVGTIREISSQGTSSLFWISCPSPLSLYLVPKGSVAVDGISLTVVAVEGDSFSVAVIPYTLEVTTLGDARKGDPVNLEMDLIGKYVIRSLHAYEEAGLASFKMYGGTRSIHE